MNNEKTAERSASRNLISAPCKNNYYDVIALSWLKTTRIRTINHYMGKHQWAY